MKELLSHCRIK